MQEKSVKKKKKQHEKRLGSPPKYAFLDVWWLGQYFGNKTNLRLS